MKIWFYLLIICPFFSWSQLPNPTILAENKVKSVEIWKQGVDPLVEGSSKLARQYIREYKREAKRRKHVSTWFFNTEGYPDSSWTFDPDNKKKTTHVYGFDEQKRLVFLQVNVDGKLKTKNKMLRVENGELNYMKWSFEKNDWAHSYTLRADSLLLLVGVVSDTTHYYFDDRETGVIGRSKYKEGKLAHRYSERWTTTPDGTPDSLIVTLDQFEEKNGRDWFPESSHLGYKLREDGSVIPGHGNNNYWNRNYYKRGNFTKPFNELAPYDRVVRNFLYKREIVEKTEVITERTFMDVHPQYYLDYKYAYY